MFKKFALLIGILGSGLMINSSYGFTTDKAPVGLSNTKTILALAIRAPERPPTKSSDGTVMKPIPGDRTVSPTYQRRGGLETVPERRVEPRSVPKPIPTTPKPYQKAL